MTDPSDPTHAPFADAIRTHAETNWPQLLLLHHLDRDEPVWFNTSTWWDGDDLRNFLFFDRIASIRGPVLDVGAGAGRTSLPLQQRGIEVVALDRESACVEAMRKRGVEQVVHSDIHDYAPGRTFATILLMDSTFGMVGVPDGVPPLMKKLDELLAAEGVILIQDAYREANRSVMNARFEFHGRMGEPFRWLYVGPLALADLVRPLGWDVKVVAQTDTEWYYVAELRRRSRAPAMVIPPMARRRALPVIIALVVATLGIALKLLL